MSDHSAISEQIVCEVAFHDVDLAQVVWHGHYLRYLENARWALMRAIGFDLPQMVDSGFLWPIVDLRVRYVRAARYRDQLRVRASLREWQHRLVIDYLVTDENDGSRVVRARTIQAAVRVGGELQLSMPDCFTERVKTLLGERP
jgi:acyl-CoA thioester hydrolase